MRFHTGLFQEKTIGKIVRVEMNGSTGSFMGKRVLVGSYSVPGSGGASTSGYKLFEILRQDGFDARYLNLIDEPDADYFRYVFGEQFGNPKGLEGVHNRLLPRPPFHPHPRHPEVVRLIEAVSPDVMIGVGYIAALLMKQAAPERRLIFLACGCAQAEAYLDRGLARDIRALLEQLRRTKTGPWLLHRREKEAVDSADLIMANSDMTRSLYESFFAFQAGKIYPEVIWFAEWVYQEALDYAAWRRPFQERDIDVLFVTNQWDRPVKNYPFVKKIISRSKKLRIHVVGEVEEKPDRAVSHGLITDREELFALMGRSKTVVSPSLFDTAPGILFEASAMGCNIIASKNCGNWRLCHEALLVDPFDVSTFLEKIYLSVEREFADQIDQFLNFNSYRSLIETIEVL